MLKGFILGVISGVIISLSIIAYWNMWNEVFLQSLSASVISAFIIAFITFVYVTIKKESFDPYIQSLTRDLSVTGKWTGELKYYDNTITSDQLTFEIRTDGILGKRVAGKMKDKSGDIHDLRGEFDKNVLTLTYHIEDEEGEKEMDRGSFTFLKTHRSLIGGAAFYHSPKNSIEAAEISLSKID